MVTRLNFRLIIFFLIFFKLQGTINSQDKMKDISINISQALESYKSKKLKIIDINKTSLLIQKPGCNLRS